MGDYQQLAIKAIRGRTVKDVADVLAKALAKLEKEGAYGTSSTKDTETQKDTTAGTTINYNTNISNGDTRFTSDRGIYFAEDYASLNAFLTFIGDSEECTLIVSKLTNVTATVTLTSNVHPLLMGDGAFNIYNNAILTWSGLPETSLPMRRIFYGEGSVVGLSEARPEWWGTNQTALQAAITAATTAVIIDSDYTVDATTSIANKTDFTIEGKGAITLTTGSATVAKIFDIVGTVSNLTIRGLTLVGEGNASYYQYGIGADSGQTIDRTYFEDLYVKNLNVGISVNANTSGSWTNAFITRCSFKDITGTATGQGYGIVIATGANAAAAQDGVINITDCNFDNAGRHELYISHTKNVTVKGGTIKNHRKDVYNASFLSALVIARSENVSVQGVLFQDCWGRCLSIASARDEDSDYVAKGIRVQGCIFDNYRQVAIGIGGEDPANDYPVDVAIEGNTFRPGTVAAGANENLNAIYFYSGYGVRIRNNQIGEPGVTYPNNMVAIYTAGNSADYATYTKDLEISSNQILIDASSGEKGISLRTHYLQGTGNIRIYDNDIPYAATPYSYEAAPTNPNMSVVAKARCQVIGVTGAGCADGTTAGFAKSTTTVYYISGADRKIIAKAATDDLWDLTGVSTGANQYRKVLLCLDDTGTGVIVTGEVAATQAAAKLPLVPNHLWCPVGVVTITQNYAGGDLAAAKFYDLIGVYGQQ